MNNEDAKYNYQGQAYDYIAFDELTQFTFPMYDYLRSRNRPNGPGIMFDFAETTKDTTAEEILNYYRNLYYLDKLCKKYTEEDKK